MIRRPRISWQTSGQVAAGFAGLDFAVLDFAVLGLVALGLAAETEGVRLAGLLLLIRIGVARRRHGQKSQRDGERRAKPEAAER